MNTESQPAPQGCTPTPWHEGGSGIFDAYGCEIARVSTFGAGIVPSGYVAPWHLSEANAALIVEAVNSHARLLEQNRRYREALGRADVAMGMAHDVIEILEDSPDSTNSIPANKANAEIRSTLAVVRSALATLNPTEGV